MARDFNSFRILVHSLFRFFAFSIARAVAVSRVTVLPRLFTRPLRAILHVTNSWRLSERGATLSAATVSCELSFPSHALFHMLFASLASIVRSTIIEVPQV